MASAVAANEVAGALDALTAAIDRLGAAGVEPADGLDAATLVRELEVVQRRASALAVDVLDQVDRRGLHRPDGHASVKVFVRHHGRLADATATRRARAVRCLRDLPVLQAAFRGGRVPVDHLDRIAKVHANPRVRAAFVALDEEITVLATRLSYAELDARLADWVRLADEDGTRDRNQAHHDQRDASLLQDLDLGWRLEARCGSWSGARMRSIFDTAIAAELALDWEKARAERGDDATFDDLPRTDAQRRFDALEHLFDLAAAGHRAETGREITTDLVIDQETFERETARLAGGHLSPTRPSLSLDPDPETGGYRCHTVDGHPVEATEAVAHALVGRLRRVVLGAGSVVIDLGRRVRLFTGPAALAATLTHRWCYWPGCQVPRARCQTDHLRPWGAGGRTDPGNGAPACGRHNRHKEGGYTVTRDDAGRLHVRRPDGTELR